MSAPVEKISNRQFMFMLFMLRVTVVISFLPVVTSADALQDAWIAAILQFFGLALVIVIIGGLNQVFPKATVVDYSQILLGKTVGKLLTIPIVFAFLYIGANDSRVYAEVIATGLLPDTPISVISASIILAGGVAALAGIEVIGRLADLFLPIFVGMLLAIVLLPFPQLGQNMGNIAPVLSRGFGPVWRGSITAVAMVLPFLTITILTPLTTRPKKALRSAILAAVLSSFVLVVISFVTVVVLGPVPASRSFFPVFDMIRAVEVGDLLERVELLVIFAWGFGLFINVSLMLFCAGYALKELIDLSTHRAIMGPLSVFMSVLSIHAYTDVFQLRNFFRPTIVGPFVLSILSSTIVVLWLAYGVRRLFGGDLS